MRNRVEPTTAWDKSHRYEKNHFAIADQLRSRLPDMALDATDGTEWHVDDDDIRGYSLQLIRGYRALATMLDDLTHEEIRSARERGASWSEIGAALNMTKQAAQQRYRGVLAAGVGNLRAGGDP